MKITNNFFVKGTLGLAGKYRETKAHSGIYTGNLFSGHDAKTRAREIGSRIGFEIIRTLPFNTNLSAGVHVTPAYVDTSMTVNDVYQGAEASHYTTGESTFTLNRGASGKAWKDIQISAILRYDNSYSPELESSKTVNTGSAIEIHNGRSEEIYGGIVVEIPIFDTFESFRTLK